MLQPSHSVPQLFDVVSQPRFQPRHVLPYVQPQPAIAGQDQPGQGRPYLPGPQPKTLISSTLMLPPNPFGLFSHASKKDQN